MIMILVHPYLMLFLLPFLLATFCFRRPNRSLPPGPPPLPIIGNLLNIGDDPHLSFHHLSQKYGPILYLKLGQVPTIVVSNADIASEILKTQDHVFCSRSQMTISNKLSYGGKDLAFCPIRSEEVSALVGTISRACSRREAINLTHIIFCFFNNIIFQEVFGRRITADGECGSSPLQDMLRDLVGLMTQFVAGDLFPSMGWFDVFTGLRQKLDKNFEKMNLMFEEKIAERILMKNDGEQHSRHEDFLDVLLHLHTNKQDGCSFTMNTIKAILMVTYLRKLQVY